MILASPLFRSRSTTFPIDSGPPVELTTAHKIRFKGGISESVGSGGPKATVVYRCRWEDRYDLVLELVGGYGSGASGFSAYTPPHAYPPSTNLRCLEISSIEGLGAKKLGTGSKWDPYTLAEITAVYSVPTYDIESSSASGQIDPDNPILYCKQSINASSAFVVLPKRKLKFSTSGKIVDSEASRPTAQAEITLEFPRVPFNPYTICKPYLGKTNSAAMLGHDAGQLLFDAIRTDLSSTSTGIDHSVVLTFLGRDADWNALVNDAGSYELVEFDGSGVRPFTQADLMAMFS
jgi:hypothetical protein